MNIELFFANLAVALSVVTLAMLYLRPVTRKVILELCHTDAAAEFWLRSTDIMAYSGAVILVLLLGDYSGSNWVGSLRLTLVLTLSALFFTVMFVASNVWKSVSGTAAGIPARVEQS
jgi:hypothetical protein